MICVKCGEEIPAGRLKALPKTQTCIQCSTVAPVAGFMSSEQKTGATINICSQETLNEINRLNSNRTPIK